MSQQPAQMALPEDGNQAFLNEGRRVASVEFRRWSLERS